MTRRLVYRITAPLEALAVARAGVGPPPREPASTVVRAAWRFEREDLAGVPPVREWLLAADVAGVEEWGEWVDDVALVPGGSVYALTGTPWAAWSGPALTREESCARCGLPVRRLTPPAPWDVPAEALRAPSSALAGAPVCLLVQPTAWLATRDLVRDLERAHLADGLLTAPIDEAGTVLLLGSDSLVAGPAYPFGPTACPVCGRASAVSAGVRTFAFPRCGLELGLDLPGTSWSWSTVYGQQHVLISEPVARWLLERIPAIRFVRHAAPGDPAAFLPEEYR